MSKAVRFVVSDTPYVLKWLEDYSAAPAGWPDVMVAEARGLALLAQAQAVRVPAVAAYAEAEAARPAYLVMEWIEQAERADRQAAGALLGERLAAQHHATAAAYGLDHHNYCGATPQQNSRQKSWVEFYRRQRLGFQLELATRRGLMPNRRRQRLERLIERLDRFIPEPEQPSLLHGDLWSGNWLVGTDGEPTILDPAVYYGEREAELAMCRLFGGFPSSFYAAYDAAWPPAPGRNERIPLYQLYHLLNHLNLFGEGYGAEVDAVLQRYVG